MGGRAPIELLVLVPEEKPFLRSGLLLLLSKTFSGAAMERESSVAFADSFALI